MKIDFSSDGSDGFWVGWQKTDPADPVGEREGVCRRPAVCRTNLNL